MMNTKKHNISVILFFLITSLLGGCATPSKISFVHKGLIDCFRLDREPVANQGCGNDLGAGNLARPNQGNYHRKVDQPMTSNFLIENMSPARLEKLPVSDCLWTAGNQAGNGDRLNLVWEAFYLLQVDDENFDPSPLHSACRFDLPFNRISISDELGPNGSYEKCFFNQADVYSISSDSPLNFNQLKSICDMDIYGIPLLEHVKPAGPYGQCLEYDESDMNNSMGERVGVDDYLRLTGLRSGQNKVSACAALESMGSITIQPVRDAILSVGDLAYPGTSIPIPETRTLLYPQIMTVIGQRNIARPLQVITNNEFVWQGDVLVSGDVGKQKWLENFSEYIRVDKVRMFNVTDSVNDVRDYIDLSGATLSVFDADDELPGVAISCPSDEGSEFDVTACQFNATPTYQIDHLADTNISSLSDPLIWQIELSSEVEGDLYIEFNLVSTYKTSEAAILAEPANLNLGDTLVGESSNQILQVTNVGNGAYMIDDVYVDPIYGQPFVFNAERLDDPVMIPYPIYLEPSGNDDEYQIGYQDMNSIDAQLDIREFETHSSLRARYQDHMEIEVESESVMLQGHIAVAQSPNPSFDGSLRMADRIYPFRYPVYQVWDLPYLLKPGEQRSVMVTASPPHVGEFKGKVSVSGYPVHNPIARTTASVFTDSYGLTGPLVEILPRSLSFPHLNGGANELSVIVVNVGDAPLIRGDIAVIDSSNSQHAGESLNFEIMGNNAALNHILKGDSEQILIKYDPGCFPVIPASGYHRAALSVTTDVGDYVVPLAGDPIRYVNSHSNCQPGG